MKTSTYKTWWQEMGAISRGMMFIEGNIATPRGLDRAEQAGQARVPEARKSQASDTPRSPISPALREKALHLYQDLLFLGGRPMTAGHNDDIDEPFPQTYADEPQSRSHRFGQRNRTPQSQTCATC